MQTQTPTLPAPNRTATATAWHFEEDTNLGVVFIQRHDAVQIEPLDWRARLITLLQRVPHAGIVGAKRVGTEQKVFSMGEFAVHPKSFHHSGKGVLHQAYRFPQEADAVCGGVMVVDAQAFKQVDGETLCRGELGGLKLGLALRQLGHRCLITPSVIAMDDHSPSPGPEETQEFKDRFGFHWCAADLDAIAGQQPNNPLLWNERYQGTAMPFDKYESRPAMHWHNYQKVDSYRQRADHLVRMICELCPDGLALDLGCGDGLFTCLPAFLGVETIGIDPETSAIDQAIAASSNQKYPNKPPQFQTGYGDDLPFDDQSLDLVYLLDVIEHLPNPVAVLQEAARVLKPSGKLMLTTPAWQYGTWSDPIYHGFEYTSGELINQVNAVGQLGSGLTVAHTSKIGGVYRDLIIIAGKNPDSVGTEAINS